MTSSGPAPQLGLRERKKQRTRQAIRREALRLFMEQGYEETTIEQIAAAVEISPSTFFNYYAAKEDVVFAPEFDPVFTAIVEQRLAHEPLGQALRHGLNEILHLVLGEGEAFIALARLSLSTPELKARFMQDLEQGQDDLRRMMARHLGRDPEDFELRVLAGLIVATMWAAYAEWVRDEGRGSIAELIGRAFDIVELERRLDALGAPATD